MFGEGSSWLWSASGAVAQGTSVRPPQERGEGEWWGRDISTSCSLRGDESLSQALASLVKVPVFFPHLPILWEALTPVLSIAWVTHC